MPNTGSGLFAQLGFAPEVTYGTYVAPTRFFEIPEGGESIKNALERMESKGLQAGRRVMRNTRRVGYSKGAAGDINLEGVTRDLGFFLKYCLGKVTSTQPNVGSAPTVWDHVGTIDDLKSAGSFSCQVGRPDIGGVVRPFSYVGGMIDDWEISNSLDEILKIKLSCDFAAEDTAQTLATPSYTSGAGLLTFVGGLVTLAGSQFDVKGITLSGNNPLDTDRRFLRQNAQKKQPIENDIREVSGSLDAEFIDLAAYNRAVNLTDASLVLKWEGATIASTYKETLQVTIPVCQFDGETPTIDDKGVVQQPLPFKMVDDGSQEPISIMYRTVGATP